MYVIHIFIYICTCICIQKLLLLKRLEKEDKKRGGEIGEHKLNGMGALTMK